MNAQQLKNAILQEAIEGRFFLPIHKSMFKRV